jgi:exodeoxyribonuclease-3
MAENIPVVLAVDYSVVPTEADIYSGHREQTNALLQLEVQQKFQELMAAWWQDALRTLQPVGSLWTFWGYLRRRWKTDKGMRLDHVLLSPSVGARLISGGVSRFERGKVGASDHAPVWIALATDGRRPIRPPHRDTPLPVSLHGEEIEAPGCADSRISNSSRCGGRS